MSQTVALAIFVKTPGISPIKTRLAKGIGNSKAETVYLHLVEYISELLETLETSPGVCRIVPYWAVAEERGRDHDLWGRHNKIMQSEGNLGERIQSIVDQLESLHDGVILIGADCPYIKKSHLESAANAMMKNQIVLGPASDGGFWLLGKRKERPKIDFKKFVYSREDTLAQIENYLLNNNHSDTADKDIKRLETLEDIDDIECLKRLSKNLSSLSAKGELSDSEIKLEKYISSIL